MIEKDLVKLLEDEGVKFESEWEKESVEKDIKEAISEDRFRYIEKNGIKIGWFTWLPVARDNRIHIYVSNMMIYKQYRKLGNLMYLRKWFRDTYKGVHFFFWHRDKRGFSYAK